MSWNCDHCGARYIDSAHDCPEARIYHAKDRAAALEDEITNALMIWQSATGPRRIREAYEQFKKLVAKRSPAQVEALERERGIYTEQK